MSISNSNERLPGLSFGKIWLLIGITLILFFIGWNVFWFSNNVFPLPQDDAKLWSYHRRSVERVGNSSVILIGTSRMQMGLDQKKFTELTGRKTIQLAIVGESQLPVLETLAEDENFHGTVISDFSEYLIFQRELHPDYPSMAKEWLKYYSESKQADDFEFWLRSFGKYLIANPNLGDSPPDVLKNIVTGNAFATQSIEQRFANAHPVFFDRSLIFDLERFLTKEEAAEIFEKIRQAPLPGMREFIKTSPPTIERYLEMGNKVESYVQKIQARGGKVIIVNFPMSGEVAELTETAFPKEQFWDVFAAATSAKTIHYKDYPQLQFECPDESHLAAKDTPIFTENLVSIIYAGK